MKSEGSMAGVTRRRYTKDFKQEAVRLVRVTQERDFLRRAAAFFAKESQ